MPISSSLSKGHQSLVREQCNENGDDSRHGNALKSQKGKGIQDVGRTVKTGDCGLDGTYLQRNAGCLGHSGRHRGESQHPVVLGFAEL